MRVFLSAALCFLLSFISSSHAAGIQVGRTRIIYDAKKKEVALPLINQEKELPWLIQPWTDTGDGKTRGPFIVTPPLFRLDPQKEQNLRIAWSGASLPEDRESLFWLNVRTIPAVAKDAESKNVLRLIYKTRLKLFWRPKGLKGLAGENCKNLRFTRQGTMLQVVNKGEYYSVFDNVHVGSIAVKEADIVAPKSTISLPLPSSASGQNVNWRCITDYGNATEKYSVEIGQG
uniref:fimbrial biogenesis chaperone n=1 Tax=Scandinavium goeteborgense TaxID=1851514 RepID=UPI001357FF31|nr:molecular chaperone [Scandinavium goeteborgense]